MGTTTSLRFRRNEAQLHALACVEREIRSQDHNSTRKYLRDFSQAFRRYETVLTTADYQSLVAEADIVLIGDYHALPSSQRFAAALLEERTQPGDRPLVLGLETIFARDQHILDEWWRREIDERELRERIRFDLEWGYDWAPFYGLLVSAREHADAVYGLDCMPRRDLRRIGARDRHAAHKLAEVRRHHPGAVIAVLFGESHLAPSHLPQRLREKLPGERVLTVLQNVDPLYWQAAGEPGAVEAVRVAEDVVCVFNSTPLEKCENYRLHLDRWGQSDSDDEEDGPDFTPTIYNLIDGLARFLDINRHSSHNSTQPRFLVDLMPEVYGPGTEARFKRLLARLAFSEEEATHLLLQTEERGSLYLPQANVFYVSDFQIAFAAEEAARFLHQACRSMPLWQDREAFDGTPQDEFYTRVIEHALAYLGPLVLCPTVPSSGETIESGGNFSLSACQRLLRKADRADGPGLAAHAREQGRVLGAALYQRYVNGSIARADLRRFFLTHLNIPGRPKEICQQLVAIIKPHRHKHIPR